MQVSVAYLLTSGNSLSYDDGDIDFWEETMKKTYLASAAALLASTSMTLAGGIERTSQSVDIIFEEGSYTEFSFSLTTPSVSGIDPLAADTGIMSPSYFALSGGYKTDVSDQISLAIIFDQPFGALAEYTQGFYTGVAADLTSSAITVIGSYDVSDRIVIFGGGSYQTIAATAAIPIAASYTIDADSAAGFGFVLGAAYQIPDIALRVALTYRSSVSATHDTIENSALIAADVAGTMEVTTPQSVNLEFQTGINEKTLVFGSIRWVDWSEFDLTPENYAPGAIVDLVGDSITYNIGVGRRLSDTLSAAVSLGYEQTRGGAPVALAPTDGFFSVGAGVTYTLGNIEITGGARYVWLGDATGPAGTFEDNSALGFGIGVAIAM